MKRLLAPAVALFLILATGGMLVACSSDGGTGPVTRTQAGIIATNAYGGTVKEVESDDYTGKDAWEVEVRDSNRGRIEVKIEKSSGKILSVEQDED